MTTLKVMTTKTQTLRPTAGARTAGDRYYPTYGNGGYLVASYDIRVAYDPRTAVLTGTTMIVATATQDLSEFSLDFALDVTEVRVDDRVASSARDGLKLVVTPAAPVASGAEFVVTVDYSGQPGTLELGGRVPFITTPTGAITIGMPEVSASWFPANDHPGNKATYRISITVPDGLTAISNGVLASTSSARGYTTWNWFEPHPMATYLALFAVGDYDVERGVTPRACRTRSRSPVAPTRSTPRPAPT